MRIKFLTGLLLLLLPFLGVSQGEWNNWYFGVNAGITFNSGVPVSISSPFIAANPGKLTVSISDSLGNFLFYTDGLAVYNKNFNIMPNGSGTFGTSSLCQPSIAFPMIGEQKKYYLFRANFGSVTIPDPGLRYSIVDMNLDGGLGDIVPGMKNLPIPLGDSVLNQVTAIRHHNNRDVWVIARRLGVPSTYLSYLVTSSGINPPVVSNTDIFVNSNNADGHLRISPDGKKLVCSSQYTEVCNFNDETGVITPLFFFLLSPNLDNRAHGAEFSMDSKYLYLSETFFNNTFPHFVYQFDASKSDSLEFRQSQVNIGSTAGYSMQMGPDGKIYVDNYTFTDSLSVIHNPSSLGLLCNFQLNAVSLNGNASSGGLSTFLQRYKAYIHSSGQCQGHPVAFSGDIWPAADTTRWNFGDPASGASNVSTQTTPTHLYANPGTYTVTLYVRHNDNRTDTTWRSVTIHPTPSPDLGPDQTILQGDQATFDAGSCAGCTYQWANLTLGQPNIGTGQTYSTGVAGVYMVSVTSQNGCVGIDTVQLTVIPVNPTGCSGYEFWFAAPAVTNHTVSPSPVSLTDLNSPISMFFTTDEGPATVTVDQPANPLFTPITCTVENDSAEVIILTPFLEMIENKPADSLLNYGLRVSSDKRISASYEIQSPYNAATWSLYGKDALGYSFIVPAQHNYSNYPHCSPPARNSFEVVATEDSTIVTIIPAKDVIGHSAHVPFSFLMNRGQTWSGRATSGEATMHLGGTTVTSTKPVAVTVTDDALFLPGYDDLAFDVAGDQLVPENLAGKEFIALAMSIPAVKTLILCYAKEDNTTVVFNDSLSIKTLTVNQGECAQFAFDNVTSGSYFSVASIRSNKPVLVYEFTGNENEFMQPYHSFQASASIIPPLECHGSKKATISSTPPGAPWHNWLVYAVAKRENGDGFICDPPNWITNVGTPVPGTDGVWGYSMHGISNSDYYYRVKITNTKGRFFIPAYSSAVTSTGQFSKYAYFTDFTALNLGVDRKMCPGDCILLDAGIGWDSYLWSTGDTTSTIMASSAGTYWVSTTETGCQLSDTIVISYHPFTPVNLGPDRSICAGDSTLLNAGPGRSWYLWNTGATSQSIWAKNPGNYWVKTSGGHCDVFDTVAVSIIPPPSITTTPLSKTICTGENTNIALAATVTGTVFHWTATLTSGNITGFSADSGLVINQTLINIGTTTGVVTYHITPKVGDCAGAPVDYGVTVSIGNPVGVTISASATNICAGTPVIFTATVTNGGTLPTFQWKVNGINAGTNSPTFTYTPNDGDQIIVHCQSSIVNCISNNPATSAPVTITVNPNLTVGVTVTASSNPICQGNSVTFTATPVNGGATPLYQWFVNGVNQFTGSPVFAYTPTNSDQIFVICNSSIVNCISNNPATSPTVTMVVNSSLPAGVTIAASSNPFCPGAMVTFTATPLNGGTAPTFQWLVNGANQFTGSPVYQFAPQAGDSIRCIMTSNLSCVTGNPATSNTIVMATLNSPHVTFTPCFDTITTVNAKPYQLKGGLPLGGTYSGPGVNSTTGIFTPSLAGPGTRQITYTYQNTYGCDATKQSLIHTFTQSLIQCGFPFTDIRDGKTYPTVQIGSQCWMQTNLGYGTEISSNIPQTDNCIPEKYTRHASPVTRHDLYQWDELMQYQTAEGSQGLCPPGWHVPTESDWTTLMNYYQGAGLAGRPLQDTIINGFRALKSGVFYLNTTWSFLDFATMFWSSTLSGSPHPVGVPPPRQGLPTPPGSERALAHGMNLHNFSVSLYPSSRANAFGVRCLKDN